ncbi:MAG TPA: RNA polymerase sigma factor [Bryobacteraceae bacterium]|nr:RNA polymerase sigma factor [Bryobacteraceae bacterium]
MIVLDVTPRAAFDRYHQAVYRFAYRLTAREDLAEDITQECFLAFVRNPQRYDRSRGSVKTYLFAIARHLALKHYRDEREHEPLEEEEIGGVDAADRWEISSAVARAVADLPQLQRETVILFEYEGFTLEEIAGVTSAEVGTIKSRLHRARENLRRSLAAYREVGDEQGTV